MTESNWPVSKYQFSKSERIKSKQDISAVFERGKHFSVNGLKLNVLTNGLSERRVVFITVKKYGNAVQRNRARRVLSECWRLLKHKVRLGLDLVIVIFPSDDSFKNRCNQLNLVLKKSALINI